MRYNGNGSNTNLWQNGKGESNAEMGIYSGWHTVTSRCCAYPDPLKLGPSNSVIGINVSRSIEK